MKNLLLLATALLPLLGCASTPGSSGATSGNDGAELTAVIDAVRQVIVEAETRDVAGFPALRSRLSRPNLSALGRTTRG